jgi:hypothetical protein
MPYSLTPYYFVKGQKNNLEIKHQRAVLQIKLVKINLDRDGEILRLKPFVIVYWCGATGYFLRRCSLAEEKCTVPCPVHQYG